MDQIFLNTFFELNFSRLSFVNLVYILSVLYSGVIRFREFKTYDSYGKTEKYMLYGI